MAFPVLRHRNIRSGLCLGAGISELSFPTSLPGIQWIFCVKKNKLSVCLECLKLRVHSEEVSILPEKSIFK
jgi:hypothetical protein